MAAHVIGVSAAAGVQSQRIAYLLAMAHARTPETGWRNDVESAIGPIVDGQDELERINPPAAILDPPQQTALARETATYVAAARTLERDPSAAAAFAALRSVRPSASASFRPTAVTLSPYSSARTKGCTARRPTARRSPLFHITSNPSGRQDLNLRLLRPKRSALPS
jgi:hypothetical protein